MSIKSGSMNHSNTIIADDENIHYSTSHTDVKSLYGKVCYHSDRLLSQIYKLSLHLNPPSPYPLSPLKNFTLSRWGSLQNLEAQLSSVP